MLTMELGGPAGNERLTSSVGLVLALMLLAEGVTILSVGDMLAPHMLIGVALVPPVLLKLASTGYRFVSYYARAAPYREKGPPQIAMRALAPMLVAATVGVFATGIALLAVGHRSGTLLEVHKVTFIVWGACFGMHFLVYVGRALRTAASDWQAPARRVVPGATTRAAVLAGSLAAGGAAAAAVIGPIDQWQRGPFG